MAAVKLRWPRALIQFEDFQTKHAGALLQRFLFSDVIVDCGLWIVLLIFNVDALLHC